MNTFHLGYKNQSVYAVSGTNRCLFSDKHKTHKYSVGRTYSCWMLKCWCITWPVDFKRLKLNASILKDIKSRIFTKWYKFIRLDLPNPCSFERCPTTDCKRRSMTHTDWLSGKHTWYFRLLENQSLCPRRPPISLNETSTLYLHGARDPGDINWQKTIDSSLGMSHIASTLAEGVGWNLMWFSLLFADTVAHGTGF